VNEKRFKASTKINRRAPERKRSSFGSTIRPIPESKPMKLRTSARLSTRLLFAALAVFSVPLFADGSAPPLSESSLPASGNTVRLAVWTGAGLAAWDVGEAELGISPEISREERARRMVQAMVDAGSRTDGVVIASPGSSPAEPNPRRVDLYPRGTTVDSVMLSGPSLVVRISAPASWLAGGAIDDELLEKISRQLIAGLDSFPELREYHVVARDSGRPGALYRPLPSFLPAVDREALVKEREGGATDSREPLVRRLRPEDGAQGLSRSNDCPVNASGATGALAGKQIFFSQCHGWIDYNSAAAWETQRAITNGIVEDFVNPEAVDQYLLTYFRNAGADFFTLRESDMNSNMVIVDDEDRTTYPANGTYVESGNGAAFSNSPNLSFGNFRAPYSANDDPLRAAGYNDRLITTTAAETARATWTPVIPAAGFYNVYVSYTRNGSARASDAHYIVSHTGGQTHFHVNQERHGWVWVFLGRFHFNAGSNAASGSVALANDSLEAGDTVSADAVRFGGGMGDIFGDYHTVISGHPRWEEGARPFTQYMGGSSSVWSAGDVTCRSKWAAWENYAGLEDSIYVSWHSNAFDTTARGTTSYIYSSNPPDGTYDPTQSITGSSSLMNKIHDEIINDVRQAWDATWQDRGYRSAYFGEINPANNNEMPATLLEVAFHDNATDADQLKDPRFRRLLARAIYQGIVKYFAARDGIAVRLLPEPPRSPEVHWLSSTSIRVSWTAPVTDTNGVSGDAATGYRVYLSSDGLGFDGGRAAAGTSLDITGLQKNSLYFVQVTATNAGGESFPSETLAVRLPDPNDKTILIVNAFDRLDRSMLVSQNEPDLGGAVQRMYLDRMNDFNYTIQHATALSAINVAINSASNEAVANAQIVLSPSTHSAVDWIAGEESTADETVSTTEQQKLATYLQAGGALFLTGAEIGWDLDHLGSAGDQTFYNGTCGTSYVADDAGVYAATGVAGSILNGITGVNFDDGTHGTYDANYPDAVTTVGAGSTSCLTYSATAYTAGIRLNTGIYRVVQFGFPFETIWSSSKRSEVMTAVMNDLIPCIPPALALSMTSAKKSGAGVLLTLTDPNPPKAVTGYSYYRAASPSGPWSTLDTNAADQDGSTAGIQWTDPTPAGALNCYTVTAWSNRCPAEGPR